MFVSRSFEPALELWTTVQSLPETGLAIVALGKRDVSFDMGLPVPLLRLNSGRPSAFVARLKYSDSMTTMDI